MYSKIKKFESYNYDDVLKNHLKMSDRMSTYLIGRLKVYVSDVYVVTFEKDDPSYSINHHQDGIVNSDNPNGLYLHYEKSIMFGETELTKIKIGIVVWLVDDHMVEYVKFVPNEYTDFNDFDNTLLDPYPEDISCVSLDELIESIEKGIFVK